jgi:hypothetical protein
MELSSTDYKKIVQFYQLPKSNNKTYKELAEDVLASKLCKCIKKVRKNTQLGEKSAIGICRNNIFQKRNIDFYNFKCKKGHKLLSKKGTQKQVLNKFRNKTGFNKTKKTKRTKT